MASQHVVSTLFVGIAVASCASPPQTAKVAVERGTPVAANDAVDATVNAGIDVPDAASTEAAVAARRDAGPLFPSVVVRGAIQTPADTLTFAMGGPILNAKVHVGANYAATYGGRITNAIQIVAIDARSGLVENSTNEGHLAPHLTAHDLDVLPPHGPTGMGAELRVDFRSEVPTAGAYHVFLWLDELVTPSRSLWITPPALARTAAQFRDCAPLVHVVGDAVPGESLALTGEPPEVPAAFPLGVKITGSVGAKLVARTPHERLALLALAHDKRVVSWCSLALPAGAAKSGSHFEMALADLAGEMPPQRVFLLASFGGVLSEILVVGPKR